MPHEKIKRITRQEIMTSHPINIHIDAFKYYTAGHNNG